MVSVVIPSWNGEAVLARCLATLGPASPDGVEGLVGLEIIVVDDASIDGSAQMVRRDHPTVRLIEHASNRGFAASCNDGAAVAAGEWFLFLNSDAFIDPARVAALVRTAESLGASALGPQLLYEDGAPQDSGGMFPTPWAIALTKLGRLVGRDLPGASHIRRVGAATPCEWVTGACLLMRAAVFRAVGGFDDRLTYVEDVELGRRVVDAGGRLFLTGSVTVTHLCGVSFGLIAARVPRLYRRSQRVLARTYMSRRQRAVLTVALATEGAMRAVVARWRSS